MQNVQTTMPLAAPLPEARPIGELLSELAQETGSLVRKEVELATTEMTAKAQIALKELGVVIAGAFIAAVGGLALLFAVILGLGTLVPLWLASLIVGVVLAGLGAAVGIVGVLALKALDPAPRHTIQTLKENRQWISAQVAR
jgi:hypothetical protein